MKLPEVSQVQLRTFALLSAGLAGFAHETFMTKEPREIIVLASLALLGIPLTLHADEKRNGKDEDDAA